MNRALHACCCLVPTVLASCGASPPGDDFWPQPSPLGRELEALRAPRVPDAAPAPQGAPEPSGELTMAEAMSLALLHGPELLPFAWEIRAREAAAIQAGLWPNPELEVELENFGGSGEASGFDASETTFALGQTILLGGKLQRRVGVAQLERDLAGWDYETARVEALTRVAAGFVETLAGQERLSLAQESEVLAGRILASINERVEAGKVSPVERSRARIELAQATLDRQRAERELIAARHRLAASWGSTAPAFERAGGDLRAVTEPPSADALVARVEHNPDLARWATEVALRRELVRLAQAQAVPDVTIFAGPRLLEGDDETAFVAGVSIPLPLFDRNQGALLESRVRHAQAAALRRAAEVRVRVELAAAAQILQAGYIEVDAIANDVEPSARSAFEAAEEAFRQGKTGTLELLDSQRTLFDLRRRHIEALAGYHQAVNAVERLIGAPLHDESDVSRQQP